MSKFKNMKNPIMLSVKEYLFLKSLIPDWAKTPRKRLDPTMYGTGSYKGDMKVMNRLKALHKRLFPGDFVEEDFDMYYPEDENNEHAKIFTNKELTKAGL